MITGELKVALAMGALLVFPGWAFLSITQLWRHWPPLQRWIIAIGLSITLYPVLFYFARWFFPQLQIGARKNLVLLIVLFFITVWGLRKDWRKQFEFESLEWIAILIFALTLFTRLWAAHLHPYPAWSDSLHHSIITQLVAQTGQLPFTLEPYEPVALDMYHLGLYSLSGTVQQLAQASATTSLLWTSQILNGLCGLGVYLVLDRMSGRRGALVGAVAAGLFSFQPAWYLNWGRFPQVASQTVLFIAWAVTVEVLEGWQRKDHLGSFPFLLLILASGLLNAGVFLLHFRVAGLYLPLLAITVLWQGYLAWKEKKITLLLGALLMIAIFSLILVSPALWSSLREYIQGVSQVQSGLSGTIRTFSPAYYDYSLASFFDLGSHVWFAVFTVLAFLVGLWHKNRLTILMLLWLICLWLVGNAYRVGWYGLSFVNYTGIMIMFYLPFSTVIGNAVELIISRNFFLSRPQFLRAGLGLLLFSAAVSSNIRVSESEEYRYFIKPSDLPAMDWIRENIPLDAVFAVNTYRWLDKIPHGTDGGYWIPYFTGRRTTTGTMMFTAGSPDYVNQVLDWSEAVSRLDEGPEYLQQLCSQGVKFAYLGESGNNSGKGLMLEVLQYPGVEVIYAREGVTIIRLCK
jgi:hypothetical protein